MKQVKLSIYVMALLCALASCQIKTEQDAVIPEISWELKQNLHTKNGESHSILTLKNTSESEFPEKGWKIYFNFILSMRVDSASPFNINHVNGDFMSLSPNPDFKGLKMGSQIEIPLLAGGSMLSYTDAPRGFFIVYDNQPDSGLVCNYNLEKIPLSGLKRNENDILPVHTPEVTYDENLDIAWLDESEFCPIIPRPQNYQLNKGAYTLKNIISIHCDDIFTRETDFLKEKFASVFIGEIKLGDNKAQIEIKENTKLKTKEAAYKLSISEKGILIEAGTASGAFYGIQSLLALVPVEFWKQPSNEILLNNIEITDEPRFQYRGIFLDVARNFQSKENVFKLLDIMAFYKLNKFHFHICDDEGWRIEIPDLPELTEFGSKRGYSKNEEKYLYPSFGSGPIADESVSHGCGYYTRVDFIEIIKYANQRHIEVIPEIDMPGHARAAVKSMKKRYDFYMEQNTPEKATEYLLTDLEDKSEYKSVQGWTDNVINVGLESSYKFLAKITDELSKMYEEAGIRLKCVHTGGDEVPRGVWENSPVCTKLINENKQYSEAHQLTMYFIKRFAALLAERNIVAGGWEEIGLIHGEKILPNPEFVGLNFRPYVWNNMWNSGAEDIGYQLANAGYPIVLAHVTNLYFDLAYHKHPEEPGYYWGNFIDTRKVWEYTPFDLSKCAEVDRFGQPIDNNNVIKKNNQLTEQGALKVLGIQGLLWSENNLGLERLEYLMFPKLLGLAERAWSPWPAWAKIENEKLRKEMREAEWERFVNTVGQKDLVRLDYFKNGVGYRIPTPGAKIIDGKLHANIRYPGLIIRYTTNGDEPDENSPQYIEPVEVTGTIKLKAFAANGRGGRTVELN